MSVVTTKHFLLSVSTHRKAAVPFRLWPMSSLCLQQSLCWKLLTDSGLVGSLSESQQGANYTEETKSTEWMIVKDGFISD